MQFTSSSWMTEHNALQQSLRTVRASLLKRDALAGMGDAGASRSAGIEAKRSLKELKVRLESLDKGLEGVEGLGQGERSRREGLVLGLKDEVGNVDKMAEAGVRVSSNHSASTSMGRSGTPVNENDRKALLGGGAARPAGRVFGAAAHQAPQETAETRPLDDQGLLQLQQHQMDNQDSQLEQLSSVLQRQLRLGQDIGKEIGEQNDMLDDLSTQVDKTGGKLGRAKRQMNRCVLFTCRHALRRRRADETGANHADSAEACFLTGYNDVVSTVVQSVAYIPLGSAHMPSCSDDARNPSEPSLFHLDVGRGRSLIDSILTISSHLDSMQRSNEIDVDPTPGTQTKRCHVVLG